MRLAFWVALLCSVMSTLGWSAEDPGRAKIGWVEVSVFHATNQVPKKSAEKGREVSKDWVDRMRVVDQLKFAHYVLLGRETQPLLRSYESWAQPLRPSDEVLVRFEAQGHPTRKTAVLDLELWLSRKKTFKTDAKLQGHTPLLILGPEYRGGHLIIAVALASEPKATP